MPTILKYDYKPSAKITLLLCILCPALAAFMFHLALTNKRGAVIEHAIHLGPAGATALYWFVAALMAFLSVLFVAMLLKMRFGAPLAVELTDQFLYAPKNFFAHAPVSIPLNEITSVEVQEVNRHFYLNIRHIGGKLTITSSLLPSRAAFDELTQHLAAVAAKNRPQE